MSESSPRRLEPLKPLHKYRTEVWQRKLSNSQSEGWKTCNHEYGEFKPNPKGINMSLIYKDRLKDDEPWMISTYQKGFNQKPQHRDQWVDSWKGYVLQQPTDKSNNEHKFTTQSQSPQPEDWSTCNKEYGGFIQKHTIVELEKPRDDDDDDRPWCQSLYQSSYNTKPEYRHKWVGSWRGQVQRKEQHQLSPFKSLKPFDSERVPSLQSQASLNNAPFTSRSAQDPSSNSLMLEGLKQQYKSVHVPTIREKALAVGKLQNGQKLSPLPAIKRSIQQDIMYQDGQIYMATPRIPPRSSQINEKFFDFKFSPSWQPFAQRK